MEDLLKELGNARLNASAGQMDQAQQHLDESLELLNEAVAGRRGPKPSVRAVRGYIAEAGFALRKADSRGAVSALDGALRMLQEPQPTPE
jgi:hypothetical protein